MRTIQTNLFDFLEVIENLPDPNKFKNKERLNKSGFVFIVEIKDSKKRWNLETPVLIN